MSSHDHIHILRKIRCVWVLLFVVASCVHAFAQGTETTRQLDRVDVTAPERRAPAPAPAPTQTDTDGTADQSMPSDSAASSPQGAASGTATGVSGPATSLSMIAGKSQVSMAATSLPAQVQVVTPQDIRELNWWGDYSNLFRRVAGVKSVAYGQGQIGTSISMRGFTSSVGQEVGVFVDGVPQNFPSASQTTGKVELSWLTPEVIERIEVIKGPVSALYGDFALAGVVNIVTKKSEPTSSVTPSGGSFGAFRTFGVLSHEGWGITPYLACEFYNIDGYRDNSQLNQVSPFNKVSMPLWGGILSLRYNYFQSHWGASGYWPIDWIKSRQVSRTRAYNTTDGGDQRRYEVVMNYAPACGERGLYGVLYADGYHAVRYASFLPTTGSQFARQDDRLVWGGRVQYNMVFGDKGSLIVGGETRQDSGESQQYNTVGRQRTSTTYDYDLRVSNAAMFLQGQIKPSDYFKLVGGVRWDFFVQGYENIIRPQNSGKGFPYIQSPKIGFVFTPTANFNIFGNAATGFRSPSNLEASPYKSGTTANFDLEPAQVQTYDIGANIALFGNLYLAADYYHTYMQREIRMVNNQPVVVGDTVRKGVELEAKFYPAGTEDFYVFGNYGWVEARVKDPINPGQFLVTDISEHIVKAGVSAQRDFGANRKVLADLYYEYASGAPYYNGTNVLPVFGPDYDVYNFKLTYNGNGWSTFGSLRCRPREYSSDYTWVSNGYLVYDPPPKWEFASGVTYSW